MMRTTLDIDDTVLAAAKETAAARSTSAGAVISEWARQGLHAPRAKGKSRRSSGKFPTFTVPANATPLNTAAINAIIDDDGLPARR